ncbi:2'-5' RNA ligase family protein [Baaleninema simplex]|uniref:2'-5' RNA ligase family protein n=1 Tax=Baaleninema simplex TaxID=2862350 RepID=UPI00034DBB1F|nr:2'-5' RNA ligase family protein [Baaleninema simplex]
MERQLNPDSEKLSLYFIALLPPLTVRREITQLKEYVRDTYNSQAALKSPPHVTLQPPFKRTESEMSEVKRQLAEFAASYPPIPMRLSGFAAFPPRVVFVDVVHTPELMALQPALALHLEPFELNDDRTRSRPFRPHVTIAFRDLKRSQFKRLWEEVKERAIEYEFLVPHLTLLKHDGRRWNVEIEFPFASPTTP